MVTGSAVVPSISGQDPRAGAAVWVGIDWYRRHGVVFQTGFTIWGDSRTETWYEWFPEQSYHYDIDLRVQPGQNIRMTIYTHGKNGGNSTVENLSNGKAASHTLTGATELLCQTDVEWIVEDFHSHGEPMPFVDFGEVKIKDAYAEGANGRVTPEGSITWR